MSPVCFFFFYDADHPEAYTRIITQFTHTYIK